MPSEIPTPAPAPGTDTTPPPGTGGGLSNPMNWGVNAQTIVNLLTYNSQIQQYTANQINTFAQYAYQATAAVQTGVNTFGSIGGRINGFFDSLRAWASSPTTKEIPLNLGGVIIAVVLLVIALNRLNNSK